MLDRRSFLLEGTGAVAWLAAGEVLAQGNHVPKNSAIKRLSPGTASEIEASFSRARELISRDPKAAKELLAEQARRVFETNRVQSKELVFHIPSAGTYRSFFAWDSGWHAIALSVLDPEAAHSELEAVFSFMTPEGRVPHEVRLPEMRETNPLRKLTIFAVRRQYDDEGKSSFIDPPSFLIAGEVLYERTKDSRVFELIPRMEKCAEYLTGPRDLFGEGLVSIVHPWESGTDAAPVFDEPLSINLSSPFAASEYLVKYLRLLNFNARLKWDLEEIKKADRFVMEDLCVNGLTAAGLLSLSRLFSAAGERKKAEKWRRKAEQMVEAMEELLWDDELGWFYPRWSVTRPRLSRRTCLSGIAPLLTGMVSEDKAARAIEEKLLSPRHFHPEWLVPFNSVSELEKERIPMEETLLWRGHCIWMSTNWIAARAAEKYGRVDLAREIARKSAELVLAQGFREFYDFRTGEGQGAKGFTWPALVLDLIERYQLG